MARFLVDENVPSSIADYLHRRGHDIALVKEVLMEGAPDQLVAKAAQDRGAMIVTWNIKHYRKEAAHFVFGILGFRCKEPDGLDLLDMQIDIFEAVLAREELSGKQVFAEIQPAGIKFHTQFPKQ